MTDQDLPWTERLSARGARVLLIGVLSALLTSGAWWYLARNDGKQLVPAAVVASGQTYRLGTGSIGLNRLYVTEKVDGWQARAVDEASYVTAELKADLTGLAPGQGCLFYLQAGDYVFLSLPSYANPEPPLYSRCVPGATGTIQASFEVPRRLLDKVDGLILVTPLPVLLVGRIS